MFKFEAIVLDKKLIKDSKYLISVFSKEYGKISLWFKQSKTKESLDIFNLYSFICKTNSNINNIDSYKTKNVININNLNYSQIKNILDIGAIIQKIVPSGMVFESIFDDIIKIYKYIESSDNQKISAYFQMRLFKKLGISNENLIAENSVNFKKIYSIIEKYSLEQLIKINGISKENLEEIENFNSLTLSNYLG